MTDDSNFAKLQLRFTIDEVNLILEALGQMPFSRVYELIGKIQEQARQQLQDGPIKRQRLGAPSRARTRS